MLKVDSKTKKIIKQIIDYDKPIEGKGICYDYLKHGFWTLEEGFKLLTFPFETCPPNLFAMDSPIKIGFLMDNRKFNIVRRAIESKKLKIWSESEELLSRWQNDVKRGVKTATLNSFWEGCCWKFKVNPFEFLEFVKAEELFELPPELEYTSKRTKSGEVQYDWANKTVVKKKTNQDLDPRSETTYLNIIGALLEFITGDSKQKEFSSETQLREFVDKQYDGIYGLKSRTLAEKFALAKKELKNSITDLT